MSLTPSKAETPSMAEKPLPPIPSDQSARALLAPRSPVPQRRATAPETAKEAFAFTSQPTTIPYRPRTRSPLTRGHTRSHSSSSLRAPQMARAHSSPVPEGNGRLIPRQPVSPLDGYGRHRSPYRKPSDESFSSFGNNLDIDQTIAEHAELEVRPRPVSCIEPESSPSSPSFSSLYPRTRRRPVSPLSSSNQQQGPFTPKGSLRASTSTPSLANNSFNETYPASFSISSSSTSTPTSTRSRSPSISSLETIPDIPDAEREEENNIARLKAAAEKEDQGDEDTPTRGRMLASSSMTGRGIKDKRNRWSVCGAERRGDLNLETIWEA